VVTDRARRPIELAGLYDDLDTAGSGWRTSVLSFAVVEASGRTADALGILEGAAVYAIERLRRARNVPLALMRYQVPASIATFSRDDLERQGMHEILRRHGAAPQVTREKVGARVATAAEARILNEAHGALLLTMERTAYDADGRAVERGLHVYRASLFKFDVIETSS
jgi:DNA-binding GntR family transcriptional regulator